MVRNKYAVSIQQTNAKLLITNIYKRLKQVYHLLAWFKC